MEPSDSLRQLWVKLDSWYAQNRTNERIEQFLGRTRGVGNYKGKIAAGNVKAVRDLVNAQKNVKSALLKARGELALMKRTKRKALSKKMEGLQQYYTQKLIAQYDCTVRNAISEF